MRKRVKVGPRIERRVGGKWISTPLDVRPDPDDPNSLLLVLHKKVIGRMTKAPAAVAASDNAKKLLERAERKRLIEDIAEAIASPPDICRDPDHRDGYVLVDRGKEIARWREPDLPGLAAWIMTRMHERWAALQLARAQARHTAAEKRGGQKSAKARGDPARSYPALVKVIRNTLKREESTRPYVGEWIKTYGIPRSTLHDLIKRIKAEPPK
jgi:hypothetical protein